MKNILAVMQKIARFVPLYLKGVARGCVPCVTLAEYNGQNK